MSLRRPDSTVGVNTCNFVPDMVGQARVRRLDGASTWKYLA
jgi:hypothetical protein